MSAVGSAVKPAQKILVRPWRDYSGQVSPLKASVFAALFLPGIWIAVGLLLRRGDFAARPLMETIHEIGLWTIRLIFITLAVTPARQILQWPRLVLVRRMIGVAAFAYAFTHLCLYTVDQNLNLEKVASEIVLRIYLTIGFAAVLLLAALAATSTDAMIRRLGPRWQQLHRFVYLIGMLAVIHYFMQSKLNVWEPIIMAGCFLWLMGYRLLAWRQKNRVPLWQLGLLAVAAGLLTALGEALYYWAVNGIDPLRVLPANLSLMAGLRPSWVVLGMGLAVALVATGRSLWKQRAKLRPRYA